MVSRFSCSIGIFIYVTLNAVITHTTHTDAAAFHEEILIAVDSIRHSTRHIEGAVLHSDVFASLDGVLVLSFYVERTFALELCMPFYIERRFLSKVFRGR